MMHRTCKLIVGSLHGRGIIFMYAGKKGLIFAVLFMMTAVLGTYGLMEMAVLAAPGDLSIEAKTQVKKESRDALADEIKIMRAGEETEKAEKGEQPLIVIDAGHGGEDSGCLGNGTFEKDINLQIAFLVKQKLEKKGFQVMMPRETDEYLAKEERVELANSYQADAYISIHQNTYEGNAKSVEGIETWYDGADGTRDSGRLAKLVHQETLKSTGANERTLWDLSDLCVTNKTLMPACLIETGFLTNPKECRLLCSNEYQEKIAEGIAEGINLYFHPKNM